MKRRYFLLGLAAAGAGTAVARTAGVFGPRGLDELRAIVDGLPPGAAELGREVRRVQAWYADEIRIAAMVLDGWDGSPLGAWLVARARAEFTAGDTLGIEGWTLARTEARVYALAALRS